MSRKNLYSLLAVFLTAACALSACGLTATATQASASPLATDVPAATAVPAPATLAPSSIEVFSLWVSPGGVDGLAAMVNVFQAQYPNEPFVYDAWSVDTNAKAALAARLAAGVPPDSWQTHAGQETIANYLPIGEIQPLIDFYAETGYTSVLPKTFIPLISSDDHPYSVPVSIYRSNVMWYNPSVLKAAKVTLPEGGFKNWTDFFAACDKIKAAGKTCLSMGNEGYSGMHLFENVMIGTMGATKWTGLWTGLLSPLPTTDWNGTEVKAGVTNYAKALSYVNSDALTLSDWQPASKMVADGEAAFNIMGDWAYGYFANAAPNGLALKPHIDFDWTPVPGTQGIFVFLSDSFVMPVGNKNPKGTRDWLTFAASKAGQEAFNPLNGSICARTDCDPKLFNEYSQEAAKDWLSNTVVGSLAHGVVAAPAWSTKVDMGLKLFLASAHDAATQVTFQTALAAACASDGTCK